MATVRATAVAGLFYPREPASLRAAVRGYLAAAAVPATDAVPPKAVLVPHAGYAYSGAVAATAYARLAPLRGTVARVVLLGPSHYVPLRGLAVPSADTLATPLGPVPVDRAAVRAALDLPQVAVSDAAHAGEHCLEVQLPFLLEVLGPVAVVPLVVGDVGPATVGAVLDRLWGGPETCIVVSSDLSHYHDPATARRMDAATAAVIADLVAGTVDCAQACGCHAVNGLLWAARRRGLTGQALDLRNSADTAGPASQVVGYGAFSFTEP